MLTEGRLAWHGRLVTVAAIALLALIAALADRRGAPSWAPLPPASQDSGTTGDSSGGSSFRPVEGASAQGSASLAETAWQRAYGEALRSRRWESLIEVGDAALRLGSGGGAPATATQRARRAYLLALLRARDLQSLDGLLRAAEAFAALGDQDVLAESLRIAEALAGVEGPAARERVAAARRRLAAPGPETEGAAAHLF